jgi:uncharacterized membrane protein YidH (DUF202 family)
MKRETVRDTLALDITALANQRTLHAYIRTALTVIVLGVGLIKLFEYNNALINLGVISVIIGSEI